MGSKGLKNFTKFNAFLSVFHLVSFLRCWLIPFVCAGWCHSFVTPAPNKPPVSPQTEFAQDTEADLCAHLLPNPFILFAVMQTTAFILCAPFASTCVLCQGVDTNRRTWSIGLKNVTKFNAVLGVFDLVSSAAGFFGLFRMLAPFIRYTCANVRIGCVNGQLSTQPHSNKWQCVEHLNELNDLKTDFIAKFPAAFYLFIFFGRQITFFWSPNCSYLFSVAFSCASVRASKSARFPMQIRFRKTMTSNNVVTSLLTGGEFDELCDVRADERHSVCHVLVRHPLKVSANTRTFDHFIVFSKCQRRTQNAISCSVDDFLRNVTKT